ncbi:MAG: tetratricopeptide repeat protein, partial [Deferrisomatales bacterium]
PLWIEALPLEEALPELFGRHEPLCRLQRARLLLLGGRPKAARDILEGLEELPAGLEAIRRELLDEAAVQAEEGGPEPDDGGLASPTLAELHAAQGDRATAAAIYRELVSRDPEDEEAHRRLRELGRTESRDPAARLEQWLGRVRRWRDADRA